MPTASALGTDTPAAEIGADWLEEKMIANLLVSGDITTFESIDASLDASIALEQVPGHETQGQTTFDAIEDLVSNYVVKSFPDGFGGSRGEVKYVGRVAKAAAVALRNDENLVEMTDQYANRNLIAELQAQVATNEPIEGRVFDDPRDNNPADGVDFLEDGEAADKANVIDQAWAVEALKRQLELTPLNETLQGKSDKAIAFLFKQQCPTGYFREKFSFNKNDASDGGQNCLRPDDRGDSAPNNLTTAQVALILATMQADPDVTTGPQIQNGLADAVAYLLDKQADNGSLRVIPGGEPDAVTTGLAGMVFAATNHPTEARKAAEWLREVQAFDPDECIPNLLTFDTGAIAPNKPQYNDGKIFGIGTIFKWKQSTALTLPLLTLTPHTSGPPVISGPTGFVHSGAKIDLRVSKLEVGERACAYGLKLTRLIAAEATTEVARLVAPAGTANRRYTVKSIEGSSSMVLKVLDTAKLKVKAKLKSVKRKGKQKVVVSGLAAGEPVRVMIKGKIVAKGKANSHGKFKKKFKVKAPKGQAVMKVWGGFNDRNGKTKFKVK